MALSITLSVTASLLLIFCLHHIETSSDSNRQEPASQEDRRGYAVTGCT